MGKGDNGGETTVIHTAGCPTRVRRDLVRRRRPTARLCRGSWTDGILVFSAVALIVSAAAVAAQASEIGRTPATTRSNDDSDGNDQNQRRRRKIPVRMVLPGENRLPPANAAPPAYQAVPGEPRVDAEPLDAEPGRNVAADAVEGVPTDHSRGDIVDRAASEDALSDGAAPGGIVPDVEAPVASAPPAALAPVATSALPDRIVSAAPSEGKRAIATRTSTAPVLDGFVDESVWELADALTDFVQKEPVAGAKPSLPTEVRVLYDDDNLYFGWILYDDEPEKIVATQLGRENFAQTDDHISVQLDTFHDHRNAFMFALNALGTKIDWYITNESQVNGDWDESWETVTQITERGWEAEIVVPFAILRYPTGSHVWGIEFDRGVGRFNEENHWSNTSRDYDWRSVSQAGHLLGLENLKLTDRFRFKPFVTGAYNSFQQRQDPISEGDGDFGIEVFKVQVTPNLTANLTVNTDFAQVEVDDERVNLTRFSLFFPEKREFFVEAADNFTFGTLARRSALLGGGFGRQPPLALLFFSRRIGLGPQGEPLPIRFGGRLTGKIGNGNIGFVNVQTGDSLVAGGKNYSALRWKQDVMNRSSIGALVTNVQGPNGEFNRVFGVDADFTLFDHLFVSGFIAGSQDDGVEGTPWVGQLSAGWETDRWGASADITHVAADFDTELGFILRQDIVRQNYQTRWSPRPGWELIRQVVMTGSAEYITDTSGRLVSRRTGFQSDFVLESGDRLNFKIGRRFERLDFDFDIDEGVGIPIGDYSWTEGEIGLRTTRRRWLNGGLRINLGEFFDGTRFGIGGGPNIRFSEKFSIQPEYLFNRIRLPRGAFSTHVVRARTRLSFSERMLVESLLQHNSVTDQLSLFARLRYIYRTGDDFYLVYRQSTAFSGLYDTLGDRSLTAKMTYAFQW